MEVKEKAKELVDRFIPFAMDNHIEKYAIYNAKQCALICVDEIKDANNENLGEYSLLSDNEDWEKVEQEIKKL